MCNEEEKEYERNLEIFKFKRLIKNLDQMNGISQSMITLIINCKDDINKFSKIIENEIEKVSNTESKVDRQNIINTLKNTFQTLSIYNKTPKKGLIIYCGLIKMSTGEEKMIKINLEPFKPINNSLYIRDNIFHTEELKTLLLDNNKFGFLIMDGFESLF